MEVGGGGVGAQNSVSSAALSKQQSLAVIGFHSPLFQSSTNFILPLKLLIGFFLVNLAGNVKMINSFFEMVSLESLCISFKENERVDVEEPFYFFASLATPFEQWGVDKLFNTFLSFMLMVVPIYYAQNYAHKLIKHDKISEMKNIFKKQAISYRTVIWFVRYNFIQ